MAKWEHITVLPEEANSVLSNFVRSREIARNLLVLGNLEETIKSVVQLKKAEEQLLKFFTSSPKVENKQIEQEPTKIIAKESLLDVSPRLVEARFASFQEGGIVLKRNKEQLVEERGAKYQYQWCLHLLGSKNSEEFRSFQLAFPQLNPEGNTYGTYYCLASYDAMKQPCLTCAGVIHKDRSGRKNPSALHLVFERNERAFLEDLLAQLTARPSETILDIWARVFQVSPNGRNSYYVPYLSSFSETIQIFLKRTG